MTSPGNATPLSRLTAWVMDRALAFPASIPVLVIVGIKAALGILMFVGILAVVAVSVAQRFVISDGTGGSLLTGDTLRLAGNGALIALLSMAPCALTLAVIDYLYKRPGRLRRKAFRSFLDGHTKAISLRNGTVIVGRIEDHDEALSWASQVTPGHEVESTASAIQQLGPDEHLIRDRIGRTAKVVIDRKAALASLDAGVL